VKTYAEIDGNQMVIVETNDGLDVVQIVKHDDRLGLYQGRDAVEVPLQLVNELANAVKSLAK
jgi:hypothetical protein